MDVTSKKVFVEDLSNKISESVVIVIAEYSGINVESINNFRVLAKEANIKVKVCKNSLFLRAIENSKFTNLTNDLSGPNIFIMSDDLIGAAKLVTNFANNNELFKIKNGSFNGDLLDKESIVTLSKMLSLDELRAKIIRVINTPATNIARMVKEPMAKVVRVINAYSKQSN
jgi:large subunit ribosomal protein L10